MTANEFCNLQQKLFEKRYPYLTIRIVGGKTKRKPARRQR
jgi:hypothetical protein